MLRYNNVSVDYTSLGFNFKNLFLPMANDSTSSYLTTDKKNKLMKSPRQSSLAFIRQFARVYMNYGNSDLTAYIVN